MRQGEIVMNKKLLIERRKELGMRQQDLADACGLSKIQFIIMRMVELCLQERMSKFWLKS